MKVEDEIIEKAKELLPNVKTRVELIDILSRQFSVSKNTINVYFWKNDFKTNFSPFRWKKGIIPWNKEKPMKEESRIKLSETLRKIYKNGKEPWNKNKKGYHLKIKRTEEYIKKLREREREKWTKEQKIKHSQLLKEYYKRHPEHRKILSEAQFRAYKNNPELRKIHSETKKQLIKEKPEILKKMLGFRRPNFSELELDSIINKNFPNLFKFIGYDYMFAKWFEGKIPDWICDEKRLLIELCGKKFHTEDEMKNRTDIFAKKRL